MTMNSRTHDLLQTLTLSGPNPVTAHKFSRGSSGALIALMSVAFLGTAASACNGVTAEDGALSTASGSDSATDTADALTNTNGTVCANLDSVCWIYLEKACTNHSEVTGATWFADTDSRTWQSPGWCLLRAREWHAYCGFGSDTYVNAAWNLGELSTIVAQQVRGSGQTVYTYGPNWNELPARTSY